MKHLELGSLQQIPPGEGRSFALDGRTVAVFRTRQGALYAVQAGCPHRDGPLADGLIDERLLVCPLHACRFELATGASLSGHCASLQTYPIRVAPGGTILLELP